jgi:O-acetyl-ADP-ribose deacetylase (regulator of RNase III)
MISTEVYDLGIFRLELAEGDITSLNVDAIVNAANTDLILGAGVAGAIRRKGGSSIQEECNRLAPIKTGDAVITNGGNLPAKYVIHTAGPIYYEYSPEEAHLFLQHSVENCLSYIQKKNLSSIAFPAISAGIYGFPVDKCAEIMVSTALNYAKKQLEGGHITSNDTIRIIFCLYGKENYAIFEDKFLNLTKNKKGSVKGTPVSSKIEKK